MGIDYQIISAENKRYRGIIKKANNASKEEDVFNLVELQPGRVTLRENRLVIYDYGHKAIVLSLFLPKMIPDPQTKADDGLKKFVVGKSKSSSRFVLRVRYHTGNWIFLAFNGAKAKSQTEFLVKQFHRLREKKMITFGIRMGRRDEYNEMKFHLVESYERMKCTYSKPRVFGLSELPYKTYYPWIKFEKPGRKKKLKKKVVVQRRRSADYFSDETKFEGYLVALNYDPAANLTVVSQSIHPQNSPLPSNYNSDIPNLSGAMALAGTSKNRRPLNEIKESMEMHDIYDPSHPSDRKFSDQKMSNPFVGADSMDSRSVRKSRKNEGINFKIRGQGQNRINLDFLGIQGGHQVEKILEILWIRK